LTGLIALIEEISVIIKDRVAEEMVLQIQGKQNKTDGRKERRYWQAHED